MNCSREVSRSLEPCSCYSEGSVQQGCPGVKIQFLSKFLLAIYLYQPRGVGQSRIGLKRLSSSRGVGWGGRWEGGSKGRGYTCTYGWFMLRIDRKQQNYVKQLIILQLNNNKKRSSCCLMWGISYKTPQRLQKITSSEIKANTTGLQLGVLENLHSRNRVNQR